MRDNEHLYVEKDLLKLSVITWNCAGNKPEPNYDISNVFLSDSPD